MTLADSIGEQEIARLIHSHVMALSIGKANIPRAQSNLTRAIRRQVCSLDRLFRTLVGLAEEANLEAAIVTVDSIEQVVSAIHDEAVDPNS